jgi:hypothetical protein
MAETSLQYPIGQFEYSEPDARANRGALIARIAVLPDKVRAAVARLSPEQLDTPYRDGGWTVRQVVHHLPDSHSNGYIRMKVALTEVDPLIKPYDEAAWAMIPEARLGPPERSLDFLSAIHVRWVATYETMTDADFDRCYRHPEMGLVPLLKQLALYAWHGDHHLQQILNLKQRRGW